MNPVIRNILAVLAGIIAGSAVNMGIITISGSVIPPPEGADITTMEGLKANMHLFEPKHFLFPFLAHALGTFAGAWLTAILAVKYKIRLAMVIGLFFLLGGIINILLLPSPLWYAVVDVTGAYLPMSYLGGKLGFERKL